MAPFLDWCAEMQDVLAVEQHQKQLEEVYERPTRGVRQEAWLRALMTVKRAPGELERA